MNLNSTLDANKAYRKQIVQQENKTNKHILNYATKHFEGMNKLYI